MSTLPESIQVWVVRVTAYTAQSWRSVLSHSEWEKAMRFRMPADQIRSTVTRGVLKTLLSHYLQLPLTSLEFTQNQFGKPSLPGAPIEFNVSHSGDYALLAFAGESPVGIDIEYIKGDRVVSDLAQRVLSPAEFARFTLLPESDRKKVFFQIWTLKESVLKAIGSGLSVPPEHFEIAFYPAAPKLLSAATKEIPDVSEWTLRSLTIGDDNYAAAIAVKHKTPSFEIRRFESPSLDNI
jgi:4'-phosphopantetheinyl transferase